MKHQKKIQKKMARRNHSYELTMKSSSHELKVQQRIDSGGYTRPGSMNLRKAG